MRGSLDNLPMVIRQSAPSSAKLLLGSLFFVATSAWLLASGRSPAWIGWLGIGFFSLGPVAFVVMWLRPTTLTIAADGVTLRHPSRALHLTWPQMRNAWSMTAHPPAVRKFLHEFHAMHGHWEISNPALSELLSEAIARLAPP